MLSWGATTMGLGGVHNYAQVTGLRFLLGVMEAGLFPGFVYYLTFWYRNSERSIRVALILASATLAGAFGGAIAFGVGHMNGAHGLSAWRWLFIIEGAPSCASAVLVWFLLPDYPETANWLNVEEKELAEQRLALEGSKGSAQAMSWEDAKGTLTDWRLYAHYMVCFTAPFLNRLENLTRSTGILWHLNAVLKSFSFHSCYHCWSGILGSACSAHDCASIRGSLCRDRGRFLVCRPFQQVKILTLQSIPNH
jgi:MFS family permease